MLEALRRLPLETQVLLELRFWEGLTGPKLARVHDVPEGTTRSRLRRATEQLRTMVRTIAQTRGVDVDAEPDFDAWAAELRSSAGRPADPALR